MAQEVMSDLDVASLSLGQEKKTEEGGGRYGRYKEAVERARDNCDQAFVVWEDELKRQKEGATKEDAKAEKVLEARYMRANEFLATATRRLQEWVTLDLEGVRLPTKFGLASAVASLTASTQGSSTPSRPLMPIVMPSTERPLDNEMDIDWGEKRHVHVLKLPLELKTFTPQMDVNEWLLDFEVLLGASQVPRERYLDALVLKTEGTTRRHVSLLKERGVTWDQMKESFLKRYTRVGAKEGAMQLLLALTQTGLSLVGFRDKFESLALQAGQDVDMEYTRVLFVDKLSTELKAQVRLALLLKPLDSFEALYSLVLHAAAALGLGADERVYGAVEEGRRARGGNGARGTGSGSARSGMECFDFQKGKCDRERCRFDHVRVKPSPIGQEKGQSWRTGKASACFSFSNDGRCKFGERCKFEHERTRTPAAAYAADVERQEKLTAREQRLFERELRADEREQRADERAREEFHVSVAVDGVPGSEGFRVDSAATCDMCGQKDRFVPGSLVRCFKQVRGVGGEVHKVDLEGIVMLNLERRLTRSVVLYFEGAMSLLSVAGLNRDGIGVSFPPAGGGDAHMYDKVGRLGKLVQEGALFRITEKEDHIAAATLHERLGHPGPRVVARLRASGAAVGLGEVQKGENGKNCDACESGKFTAGPVDGKKAEREQALGGRKEMQPGH